jgi:hypothetical protein
MAYGPEQEIGGISVAARGIPRWLIGFAVAVFTMATWYLLSFSSTESAAPGPGVSVSGGHETGHG